MSASTTLARAAKRSRPANSGAGRLGHLALAVDDDDLLQAVLLAELEVDGIVGRRDLDRTGAEVALDALVGNDRKEPVLERQDDPFPVKVRVALVVGVDGQGGVAEHGLGPGGGHDHGFVRAFDLVADVPELALEVLVLDLDVREHGPAVRAAVDQEIVAVDQPLVVERDEDLFHGPAEARVHGEALPRPVERGPEPLELAGDDPAVLGLPFPGDAEELVPSDLLPAQALLGQALLDDVVDGDRSVVGARQPEAVVALHPLPPGDDVGQSEAQGVAHVQDAGDVGRRQDHGELGLRGLRVGGEEALVQPEGPPLLLDRLGVVGFVQFFRRAHVFDIHSLTSARTRARTRFSISRSISTISSWTMALTSGPVRAAAWRAPGPGRAGLVRPDRLLGQRRRPGLPGDELADDGRQPLRVERLRQDLVVVRGRVPVAVDALEGPPQADERHRGQLLAAAQGPGDVVAVPAGQRQADDQGVGTDRRPPIRGAKPRRRSCRPGTPARRRRAGPPSGPRGWGRPRRSYRARESSEKHENSQLNLPVLSGGVNLKETGRPRFPGCCALFCLRSYQLISLFLILLPIPGSPSRRLGSGYRRRERETRRWEKRPLYSIICVRGLLDR